MPRKVKFPGKFFWIVIGTLSIVSIAGRPGAAEDIFPPLEKSEAFQRYLHSPHSEIAKLLCLVGRFSNTGFKVIYDGDSYDINIAIQFARGYLVKNYRNEKAETWIKKYVFIRGSDGKLIGLKYPGGEKRPVVDVLLEELQKLNNGP